MPDEPIASGTYTLRGPGGQLAHLGVEGPIVIVEPADTKHQQWAVAPGSSGNYALRNVATGIYLGHEGEADAPAMMIKGSKQPFTWQLGQGPDEDPDTYVLISAASEAGLTLTFSLLRIFPPHAAILPRSEYRDPEWTFRPV